MFGWIRPTCPCDAEAKAWNRGHEGIATRALRKSLRHGQRGGRMNLVGHEQMRRLDPKSDSHSAPVLGDGMRIIP